MKAGLAAIFITVSTSSISLPLLQQHRERIPAFDPSLR
jgi:hypothetical protein